MTRLTAASLADLLNLRTLVLLLAAWLILAPPQPSALQWLDRALFVSAMSLTPQRVSYPAHELTPDWVEAWPLTGGGWAERNRDAVAQAHPRSNPVSRVPGWFYPVHALLVLMLLAYLLWLAPAMGMTAAILGASLVCLLLVVTQLGAQVARGYWLPLGLLIQYLWVGLALMGAHWLQRRWYRRAQALYLALGDECLRAGEWHRALAAVAPAATCPELLAWFYDQGVEHQRRQRTREALTCYRELQRRKPGYRDVPARLQALERAKLSQSGGGLAQTQVLEEFAMPNTLGRYRIERELGRGAMGVVYLGRDPHIARQVAIKTLNAAPFEETERKAMKARFFREAEAAGKLHHPNIVTVYDVGEEGELAFIAMDCIEGEPLSRHARAEQQLPVKTVYQLVAEVARALHYAHEQGIIHRDIKPGNLLYDARSERVVVTDFGIARVVDSARTQTGEVLGSPLYMSPEQLKGAQVGRASDVFSLGVTFYQLLTGALPFRADTLAQLSYQIVQSPHKPLRELRRDLPRSATRIVNKALQKNPESRYASAADMAKALDLALAKDF